MKKWCLILCFLCSTAHADPVAIRSGEHSSFSRLVLTIGEDTQWNVSPVEGGYILDLEGPVDGFETGTIFTRIPRDRLNDVSPIDENSLFLDVNCECYADAFLWRADQLVLDIVEGLDPNDQIDVPRQDLTEEVAQLSAEAELPDLLALRSQQLTPERQLSIPLAFETPRLSPQASAAEEALIVGIARAASQGFLEPAITETRPPEALLEPQPEEPVDLPGPPTVRGQPGVGISSALDRDLAFLGDALNSTIVQECLASDLFDLNSWGDGSEFHVQVASLAEELAGEFGEEPREAQDRLARLYLHFGFGAEARAVLSSDAALSQDRLILSELAGIIDDYPGEYRLISAQAGCDSPAALWAFYIDPKPLEENEKNHILQQFFALPQPLRGQMAPRLARTFISINDPDSASKLMRAAENQDVEATHEVQAARALIAEEINDPERALDVLTQQAGDNARTTPESLIRLLELSLEQGRAPQQPDLVLAAAMRQEYRGEPIALDLAVAEANALIALNQYKDALALMESRVDPAAQLTVDNAYLRLVLNAAPADFLELVFDEIPVAVGVETQNAIAGRLIEIGFPERALLIIQGPATQAAAAERRYLRAEANLEIDNFAATIDGLAGMTDPRSRELRARAFTGLGEYRSALEAAGPELDNSDGGVRQFRAGAWERLTVEDDEVLSDFANAVLSPANDGSVETLADRRAILAQSEESRRAIEGLLRRFDGVTPQE